MQTVFIFIETNTQSISVSKTAKLLNAQNQSMNIDNSMQTDNIAIYTST